MNPTARSPLLSTSHVSSVHCDSQKHRIKTVLTKVILDSKFLVLPNGLLFFQVSFHPGSHIILAFTSHWALFTLSITETSFGFRI